jgi:hypothetical protein
MQRDPHLSVRFCLSRGLLRPHPQPRADHDRELQQYKYHFTP